MPTRSACSLLFGSTALRVLDRIYLVKADQTGSDNPIGKQLAAAGTSPGRRSSGKSGAQNSEGAALRVVETPSAERVSPASLGDTRRFRQTVVVSACSISGPTVRAWAAGSYRAIGKCRLRLIVRRHCNCRSAVAGSGLPKGLHPGATPEAPGVQ
jgi:hypothetical protein